MREKVCVCMCVFLCVWEYLWSTFPSKLQQLYMSDSHVPFA